MKARTSLKVLLVANYEPDRQTSMLGYGDMLRAGLAAANAEVEVQRPVPVLGRFKPGAQGVAKWLGYVDKFVIFPARLRRRVARALRDGERSVVHICDHSNSLYVRHVESLPHLVTCHDLLAVRAARGEFPQHRVRWSGRRLQAAIVAGLRRAMHVSCVSTATRADVERLCGLTAPRLSVIPNGLHQPLEPLACDLAWSRVGSLLSPGIDSTQPIRGTCSPPFILHVGSNVWYKNRRGVLEMYRELIRQMPAAPRLVMVGPAFTPALVRLASSLPASHRVLSVQAVSLAQLEALYSLAELLVFPSLAEGFGWPVLEALACGCRVVTSNRAPLTEVGGEAAQYADPESPREFAGAVRALLREASAPCTDRVRRGLAHAARFNTNAMLAQYVGLYTRLSAVPSTSAAFERERSIAMAAAR